MDTKFYLLEYKDIFDDKVQDYTYYLKGIGKKEIVIFCSYFISACIYGKETAEPNYQINNWFSSSNREFLISVLDKIANLHEKNLTLIHIFNVLKIFEQVIKNGPESNEINSSEFEVQTFKAVLAINQEFNLSDNIILKSTDNLDDNVKSQCLSMTIAFCYFDLMYFKSIEQELAQFVKANFLFKFLENHSDKTRAILKSFYANHNIDHWKNYLKKYLPIFHAILKSDSTKPIDLIVQEDEAFEESCKFLNNLILNDEYTLDEFDFITCRSKPFYQTQVGTYRIIHPLFAIEKLYNGLFFTLSNLNKSLSNNINNFRSFFCDEFSEKYLVYEILDKSFPKNLIKLSGQEIKNKVPGIIAEPDYYVRNSNQVYLFESKDVLIDKETKQSHDFKRIEKGLRGKFYYYLEDGIRKNVGLMQLITNIKRILLNQCSWDSPFPDHTYIYPILLVHYNIYNTPGVNHLINVWLKEELDHLKKEGLKTDKIKDLVVIDINTFLLFHERFRNSSLCLQCLIKEYNESQNNNLKSFSSFISDYVIQKKYWQIPKLFSELGMDLFN